MSPNARKAHASDNTVNPLLESILGLPDSVILCPHAIPFIMLFIRSFYNAFAEESLYKRHSALQRRGLYSLKVAQPKGDPFQVNDPPLSYSS